MHQGPKVAIYPFFSTIQIFITIRAHLVQLKNEIPDTLGWYLKGTF